MYTIIKIDETNVFIGTDDQKIVKVPMSALNFTEPQIGDEVKVYKADDTVIITRVAEAKKEESKEEPKAEIFQEAQSSVYQEPQYIQQEANPQQSY